MLQSHFKSAISVDEYCSTYFLLIQSSSPLQDSSFPCRDSGIPSTYIPWLCHINTRLPGNLSKTRESWRALRGLFTASVCNWHTSLSFMAHWTELVLWLTTRLPGSTVTRSQWALLMSTTTWFFLFLKCSPNTPSSTKLPYSLYMIQSWHLVLCEVFLAIWTEVPATHSWVLPEALVHISTVAQRTACGF